MKHGTCAECDAEFDYPGDSDGMTEYRQHVAKAHPDLWEKVRNTENARVRITPGVGAFGSGQDRDG